MVSLDVPPGLAFAELGGCRLYGVRRHVPPIVPVCDAVATLPAATPSDRGPQPHGWLNVSVDHWLPTGRAVVIVCGLGAAVLLGLFASHLGGVLLGLLTLLPVASHVRAIGWRRALTEPSAVTFVLFFYLCVFPQRALGIALSSYGSIDFSLGRPTDYELATTLAIASVGTSALVEGFHYARRRGAGLGAVRAKAAEPAREGVVALAALSALVSLGALCVLIIENGGIGGTTAIFFSHSKSAAGQARTLPAAVWAVFSVPAVWFAALVVYRKSRGRGVAIAFRASAITLLAAQVLIFGSRLNALLAIMGAWIIAHAYGRRIPVAAVVAAVPFLLLLSVSILAQRPGSHFDGLPAYERYSRVAAYGVLDASIAVQERPGNIRARLTEPERWLNLPLYLVPSPVWPGKPRIDNRRMDVFVAQAVGTQYQQDTGFPTTYITEARLYGGWPAALCASLIFGLLLGAAHKRILGSAGKRASPSSLIWYCFIVGLAFTYYKDGDLLVTAVGQLRGAVYLGAAMLVTGVWAVGRAGIHR